MVRMVTTVADDEVDDVWGLAGGIYRGVESFISANQFQYPRTWYVISENLYFSFIT